MGVGLLVLVFILVALAIAPAISGWLAMILIGNLWHQFEVLSPIGFWDSIPIGFPLALLTGGSAFLGSKS